MNEEWVNNNCISIIHICKKIYIMKCDNLKSSDSQIKRELRNHVQHFLSVLPKRFM